MGFNCSPDRSATVTLSLTNSEKWLKTLLSYLCLVQIFSCMQHKKGGLTDRCVWNETGEKCRNFALSQFGKKPFPHPFLKYMFTFLPLFNLPWQCLCALFSRTPPNPTAPPWVWRLPANWWLGPRVLSVSGGTKPANSFILTYSRKELMLKTGGRLKLQVMCPDLLFFIRCVECTVVSAG